MFKQFSDPFNYFNYDYNSYFHVLTFKKINLFFSDRCKFLPWFFNTWFGVDIYFYKQSVLELVFKQIFKKSYRGSFNWSTKVIHSWISDYSVLKTVIDG